MAMKSNGIAQNSIVLEMCSYDTNGIEQRGQGKEQTRTENAMNCHGDGTEMRSKGNRKQ